MAWFKVPWGDIERYLEENSESLFQSLFSGQDSIEDEVKGLIDKDIDLYRDKVADQLIAAAAQRTMWIGGGAALPDLLPIGWAALVPAIGADFFLTLKEDGNMLLKLAYLYGRELSRDERAREALGFLTLAGDGELDGGASVEPGKLLGLIGTKHVSKKLFVEIAKRLGMRFYRKKLVALIPGLGILLSGGVNYYSTRRIGEYAKDFYQKRAETGSWGSKSPMKAMDSFQRTYIQVLLNMAKVDQRVTPDEVTILKDSLLMFGLDGPEQAAVLGKLDDVENLEPIEERLVTGLSSEDRRYILKQGIHMLYADRKKSPEEASYLEVLSRKLDVPKELVDALEREVQTELGL
jgi:uncharacterized membrane protein YebE (DUF533 family)